jgi:hypothetical protein
MTFNITINKMRHSPLWQSVVLLSVVLPKGHRAWNAKLINSFFSWSRLSTPPRVYGQPAVPSADSTAALTPSPPERRGKRKEPKGWWDRPWANFVAFGLHSAKLWHLKMQLFLNMEFVARHFSSGLNVIKTSISLSITLTTSKSVCPRKAFPVWSNVLG